MRAKEISKPSHKRIDPELLRLYKQAKAKYPMYDEETALLKFLQRSSKHGEEKDAEEDKKIASLEKQVSRLDVRVSNLERSTKK